MKAILSSAYLPNIQYISKFIIFDEIIIDNYETYLKQTFRNRACILSANGIQNLIIPIKKNTCKTLTKDIAIDYSENWQKNHYRSLLSAYKNSAFFDYYIDYFTYFFENKISYLIDFNNELLNTILKLLNIDTKIIFSTQFLTEFENNYRESIHPKLSKNKKDNNFNDVPYIQVFKDRFDFVPNLSIIDLIFNEGPLSKSIIEKTILR